MAEAGFRAEGPGEEGLAQLTQQMLFQGTAQQGALEIARRVDSLGGTVVGRTSAGGALLVALVDPADWSKALDLLLELVTKPRFCQEALELEKRARLAEIEFWQRPSAARARRLLLASVWPELAARDEAARVASVSVGDLRKFFERSYRPEKCVAGAVGPVDEGQLERRIRGAGLGARVAIAPRRPEAAWHAVSIHEPAPLAQSHVCLALPAPMAGDAAFHLLNEVLGARLAARLENPRRAVRQVRASIADDGVNAAWTFEAAVTPGLEAEAVQGILEPLLSLAGGEPVRDEEFWMARETRAARERQRAANPLAVLEQALGAALGAGRTGNKGVEQASLADLARAARIAIVPWLPQLSVACIGSDRGLTPAAKLHHVVDAHRHGTGRPSLNGSH